MRSRRPHVLIVEDNPETRRGIADALEDEGIATVAVADGGVALRACVERDPSVIVLDLALPEMDGAMFADAYSRLPGSAARIIVVSGTDGSAEAAAKIGAEAYLSKPFRLDHLIQAVKALLDASHDETA